MDASGIVDIAKRAVPHDDRPLFLFVNFLDAHSPYNPPTSALEELGLSPGRLFSRYDMHTEITLGWGSLPDGKSQYVADLYDGELRWVDTNLERLLVWVDERYGSDAVVIVTSDHGEELGEQGRVGHLYGLPQSIIHVPLFIRAPGLARGELRECVTIQSLFGFIRSCAAGDSPSLDRLLDAGPYGLISERYPSEANARVFGREYDRSWVSLIDGGYKAVGPSEAGFELLDIESSGFNRALSVSDSAAGRALQTRIDSYWEECRDTRSDDDRPLSASEERALRSLGYLH